MKQRLFSPKTHIFLWDLHEVVLKKDLSTWFNLIKQYNNKKKLLQRLNKKSVSILSTFLLEHLQLTDTQMVSQELIDAAKEAGNDALVELVIKLCSTYTPIDETVALIKELSDFGYQHHIGSNIAHDVLKHKKTTMPEVFTLFQDHTIPFIHENTTLIKKPDAHFFIAHAEKHNIPPQNFIFIDDKEINIKAARAVGMNAFHFTCSKTLRAALIKNFIL